MLIVFPFWVGDFVHHPDPAYLSPRGATGVEHDDQVWNSPTLPRAFCQSIVIKLMAIDVTVLQDPNGGVKLGRRFHR